MIEKGKADVEAVTFENLTALHIACQSSNEIVYYLIESCHANVDAQDQQGWTALHYATCASHVDMARSLIEIGLANVDAMTHDNRWTALHHASSSGDEEMVRALIDARCTVEATDKEGWTALYHASSSGHFPVVQLLVQHHAFICWRTVVAADDNGLAKVAEYLNNKLLGNLFSEDPSMNLQTTSLIVAEEQPATTPCRAMRRWNRPDQELRHRMILLWQQNHLANLY